MPRRPLLAHGLSVLTFISLSIGAALLASTAAQAQVQAPTIRSRPDLERIDLRPRAATDEVLVHYRAGLDENAPSIAAIEQTLGLSRLRYNRWIRVHRYRLPSGLTVREAIARLSVHPDVAFVEENPIYYLHAVPDDTFYDDYVGVPTDLQKWIFDGIGADRNVNAEPAWDITTGRSDVVIAVLDSGVDLDHPDIAVWTNPGEIPGNSIDDDNNGFVDDVNGWDFRDNNNDPNPDLGDGIDNDFFGGPDSNTFHGSFAASCATSIGNNATGVTGGAWNCTVMALQIFADDGGAFGSDIADAITYAGANGADVTNMSFGGGGFSSTIESAINFTHAQGAVQLASAGNGNSSSAQFPATYDHVISVGATDSGSSFFGGSGDIDGRASFSQFGTAAVDVVAPGVHNIGATVLSVADQNAGQGTAGDPVYFVSSGTSFSCPTVAGLAALIISRGLDVGANLTNDDVESIIESNTVDLPDDPGDSPNGGPNWDGNGRVDFLAAVNAVMGPANDPPTANAGADSTHECTSSAGAAVTLDGTGSSDPDMDPLTYSWSAPGVTFNDPTLAMPTGTFPIGTTTATLTVDDGNGGQDMDTVDVTVQDTTAPTINCPADSTVECTSVAGAVVTFSATATDTCDASPSISYLPASGSTFPIGTTMVTATATDAAGNSSNCTFDVTVQDTTAPSVNCPADITAECTSAAGAVVTYSATATDTCDANPTISFSPASGSTFAIGTTTVTATATDGSGNSSNCTFDVTVQDTTGPNINCPADITTECTSATGAVVTFSATATDACDANPSISFAPASGSLFPIGTTTVTATATDSAGNSSDCTFDVTVQDTTAPSINCPADLTEECTSPAGAIVTFSATATDTCDANPSISFVPASGSVFPIGTTTVTATATDSAGNSSNCTFDVTVQDTIAPSINCPADITSECTSPAGAVVTFSATATDTCDTNPTITFLPASGSVFALGTTTVTATATDSAGNSSNCMFDVTVQDTTAPSINCPADLTEECTSPAGAIVTFSATATDACDTNPSISFVPASGSTFAIGTTTVTATATDSAGNSSNCTFDVTVQDTTAPSINCPADITEECTGPTGAMVTFSATATDVCDTNPTISFVPASGSVFALGTTTVTATATDSAGNSSNCTFDVTVQDTTAPSISCPADITEECTGPTGAMVTFSATATDVCDTNPTISFVPASGSVFALGTTTVTATATDSAGNSSGCTFDVTVQDTTAPDITCPADISVKASDPGGIEVTFSVTATDVCDTNPTIVSTPASGSVFPVGTTTVTSMATDSAGNSASCMFDVTVTVDVTDPTITCPADITTECTSASGAVVSFSVTASDDCDPNPSVVSVPASGSTFPIGTTTVMSTATDAAGNTANCSFDVIVEDTTPPTVTCPADIVVGADGPTGAVVNFTVTASDTCDAAPAIDCSPASGTEFPIGLTTVICTATDAAGNTSQCFFDITVLEDALTCREGNVNAAAGPITDVVFVNNMVGDPIERRVILDSCDPLEIRVEAPPSKPTAALALFLWLGEPSNTTVKLLPQDIGLLCMPIPIHVGCNPQPHRTANSLGHPNLLGDERWPGPPTGPAPVTLLSVPKIGTSVTFFIQALIEDCDSLNGQIAISNGILVEVQ